MNALRDAARALGARGEPALAGLEDEAAYRAALALVAEAGLVAWAVPQRDGGAVADVPPDVVSVRALVALREELAHAHPLLDLALVEQGLGSYPIALAGREELRSALLPAVVSGARVAAFALTEPGAGSDLSAISTRAVRDGDGWRLDGRKTFITNAGIADFYSIVARTGGAPGEREGLTAFHLPADRPGIAVEPFEVMAPHPIGDVVLDGVTVPDAYRLGDEGAGMDVALATLARFRTSVAAAANGFARRALDESVRHLTSREQFGRRLATFQGLRFELAEMDARLRAAQLLVDEAAETVDAGGDATAAVARAKLVATETASWICDRAVQHHGGLGVKVGSVVERLFRDVRALRIYEGTSEVQKLVLAKALLARVGEAGGRG